MEQLAKTLPSRTIKEKDKSIFDKMKDMLG